MRVKLDRFMQRSTMRLACLAVLTLLLGCMGRRLFYLHDELPKLNGDELYPVTPGPWDNANVPIVDSGTSNVPDELVISTLKALVALPGANVQCDSNSDQPPRYATEYCLAI